MGDYLGATICLTELLILTLIVSAQTMDLSVDAKVLLDYMMDTTTLKASAMHYAGHILTRFQNHDISIDEPLGVALRFTAVLLFTMLWCANVGHPPVLVRDTVVKKQQQEATNDGNTNNTNTTGDTRTFEERYHDARDYLDSLAKPVGSLGTLEDWAARLAAVRPPRGIMSSLNRVLS